MTRVIPRLDEATRPKAPAIEGVTDEQRMRGRHLAAIHRMHLAEVERVERVMETIDAGQADPAHAAHAVSALSMKDTLRMFGNLCGRECQMLEIHHTIEDRQMFPLLMRGSAGLRLVVARLAEEHLVIHALIEKLEGEAVALIEQPDDEGYRRLKDTFGELARTVRSHFRYEETELADAIGFHGAL